MTCDHSTSPARAPGASTSARGEKKISLGTFLSECDPEQAATAKRAAADAKAARQAAAEADRAGRAAAAAAAAQQQAELERQRADQFNGADMDRRRREAERAVAEKLFIEQQGRALARHEEGLIMAAKQQEEFNAAQERRQADEDKERRRRHATNKRAWSSQQLLMPWEI